MMFGETTLPWSEFGLVGLVVGALFALVYFLISKSLTTATDIATKHDDTLRTMEAGHREERKEWREDVGVRQEKTDGILRELADVIRQISKEGN